MDATDLAYAGAARQAGLVRDGEVSARELVEATLSRIERLQPQLNAFRVVLAERALLGADQADARRSAGEERPLLGVPVAVKDDTNVAGETTAWGTAAHGGPLDHDDDAVRCLRDAGAIVIGKTLVPELTMLPATDTTTFGAARNPWDPARTPGGSSGGSAAAAAAGLCGVALGSDGGGSIRGPAAWCHLVGLKPTRDRISIATHVDAWQGLSVLGPLARSVADAALFMDATAGDPPEGGFAAAAERPPGRLRVALSFKAPPGAIVRLGREEREAVHRIAGELRELGHEVVERDPDYPPSLWPAIYARALRGIHEDVRDFMPRAERLEARTRQVAWLGGRIGPDMVRRVRAAERAQAARVGELFVDVDLLLTPGCADGPYPAGVMGRRGVLGWLLTVGERIPHYAAFNLTGQPAINVPAGFDDDGLPMGVQLVGRHGADDLLLAVARSLEERHDWAAQRPPAG